MLIITTFYLIQMSRIRNSSPLTFHPDALHPEFCPANILPYPNVSYPEFFSPDIPLGYLTSEILSGPRSIFSGYLISGILSGRRSTFSGDLASGIMSDRHSTCFFILRAFSLGSKITFLIKLCCHFYFQQAIFILPLFLKCVEISKESNSVIPNNGVIRIDSGKIKRALVEARHMRFD